MRLVPNQLAPSVHLRVAAAGRQQGRRAGPLLGPAPGKWAQSSYPRSFLHLPSMPVRSSSPGGGANFRRRCSASSAVGCLRDMALCSMRRSIIILPACAVCARPSRTPRPAGSGGRGWRPPPSPRVAVRAPHAALPAPPDHRETTGWSGRRRRRSSAAPAEN